MRTEELLSIDERTYVRKSFERNDGLRSTATGLTALAAFVLIVSIVAGVSMFNNYMGEGLDYQLMAAFPNWRELIDRQPPRDIKKEQK